MHFNFASVTLIALRICSNNHWNIIIQIMFTAVYPDQIYQEKQKAFLLLFVNTLIREIASQRFRIFSHLQGRREESDVQVQCDEMRPSANETSRIHESISLYETS